MSLGRIAGKSPGKQIGASICLRLLRDSAIRVILIGQIRDAARVGDGGQFILVRIGISGNAAIEISNREKPAHRIVSVSHGPADIVGGGGDAAGSIILKLNVAAVGRGDLREITVGPVQLYFVAMAVNDLNHSLTL